MHDVSPHDRDAIDKTIRANVSPRYLRLEGLERWAAGTQYEGRKSWFDDEVPLWERAPCVVYPVVDIAVGSFVDLLLGEGRFPAFSTKPDEDDEDDEDGLDEEASEVFDKFVRKHHDRCGFRAYAREALAAAMCTGTTVGLHGAKNGKPFAEALPSKWCTPEFDADGKVKKLEIRYPYLDHYKDHEGKWRCRVKLYRRVVDAATDTVFLPADARADGIEPEWTPDTSKTVAHGFGFCPVVWYAFAKGTAPVNQIDGHAIHELITDEIQAHDIARSQWHRCALLSEPQVCEIGVEPGHNPTDAGRMPVDVLASREGGPLGPGNPPIGGYRDPVGSAPARKKGPGYVWQYPNPETKVEVLTTGSEAIKAQQDNCSDLRVKLQESMCVVFLDPENIKFAATTSGKALEAIKQKQIDRCDKYRDDLRDNFLIPSVDMQLRIADKVGAGLRIPGIKKALPVLKKFAAVAGEWVTPHIKTEWGSYFKPDPEEQQKVIAMVQEALGGASGVPLATLRLAVKKIASIFDIDNIDAHLEALEKERAEADERARQKLEDEAATLHKLAGGEDEDDGGPPKGGAPPGRGGAGARPNAPKGAGGRNGTATASPPPPR